jgi:hypothetical protein
MVSFRFNSLAMRSSPQVRILCGHLSDESPQVPRQGRSANRPGFPAPEKPKSLAVPAQERFGLDVHQGTTPKENAAQDHHDQPSRIIGSASPHIPLLEQGELFA